MNRKLCFTLLAVMAMTLAMVTSGFATNDGVPDKGSANPNSQIFQVSMATTQGGTLPTDIVADSTNSLQNLPSALIAVSIQVAQEASPMNSGSGAQLATYKPLAGVASSGGSSFHAGKMLASFNGITPADLMMTSIAT